jgi:LPXTG-site transpeptidase (sortase) family protein
LTLHGGARLRRTLVLTLVGAVVLTGCTDPASSREPTSAGVPPAGAPAEPAPIPQAREGGPAKSTRIRFAPEVVILPGLASAPVDPARTVDGELRVPDDPDRVGWWDGSAYAGDPFGNTVIAGHVDSATDGIGYFARLLKVKKGDVVTVRAGSHQQRYRVRRVQTVAKLALSEGSRAFEQTGPHQLVLITCTGTFRPERGGYDSNLVITARAVGLAS